MHPAPQPINSLDERVSYSDFRQWVLVENQWCAQKKFKKLFTSHLPCYLTVVAHSVVGGLHHDYELATKAAGIFLGGTGRDQVFGFIPGRKADSSQWWGAREYAAGF